MALRLHDWGPSPFCLKVRAILDYKHLEYERTNVLGRGIFDVTRRGGIGKVPALEVDGELVCDSTDIALELEGRYPEPAIVPSDPRQRGLCFALEDWADEALYWLGIYFQWFEPAGRAQVPAAFGRSPFGRAARAFYQRRLHRQLRGQGTGRKPPEHVRRDLERALDAAADLLADRDYLIDGGPWLCDFAVAAQLVYVARTPVGGEAMQSRPALGAFTERMRALRKPRDAAA